MRKAVLYARWSPRPCSEDCESNETQIELCRAFCKSVGYEVVDVLQDADLSGSRADNRPGLQDAIRAACKEKAILVAYSLSRIARNTEDLLRICREIEAAGGGVALLDLRFDTSTPHGKMALTIMAAFAEYELAQIRQRTSDAMRRHQLNGRKMSSKPPFGFSLSGDELVPNEDEQVQIALIRHAHQQGMTDRQIAKALRERGLKFRSQRWKGSLVKIVRSRPFTLSASIPRIGPSSASASGSGP